MLVEPLHCGGRANTDSGCTSVPADRAKTCIEEKPADPLSMTLPMDSAEAQVRNGTLKIPAATCDALTATLDNVKLPGRRAQVV